MGNIRILLADDDPIIREGLSRLLNEQEGLAVVATATDGAQAIDQLRHRNVDLALLDVDMPVMSGIEAAKRISQDYPHIVIVMLTVFEHEDSLGEAIGAGVRGFLTKDIIAPELAQLIRKAYGGQQVMAPRPTEILITSYEKLQQNKEEYADFVAAVEQLPEHLRAVFHLLLQALANKNIARQTGLSETTVRSYVSDILARTGCATRAELGITAIKAGIMG
ncbi:MULTISPECIES: response regulator transcription factor [Actinotignum]|uniref:response regulator transcription factor n=1 Tax=Actinotignum TaxID=1653174 RepID=UPI00254C4469|nr:MULTISPECIES: response regulator transcription factor [Actinotignum]MDE1536660.1 response regulator transcription factor [Actinotignum schaalii]MDK7271886.1 response regulator transcription factor [Actinotignum schaalii]MDY5144984.1 response regulator transcription factor [Actinotignum timonense]